MIRRRRTLADWLAAGVIGALVFAWFGHAFLNYDTFYALVWGGYVDLPTAAFVVWAAVLEARQPKRGAPVLILLTLAGLLRPEAWLYAGAYWVWLGAPLRLIGLAAAGPLIWLASDLAITGDALH